MCSERGMEKQRWVHMYMCCEGRRQAWGCMTSCMRASLVVCMLTCYLLDGVQMANQAAEVRGSFQQWLPSWRGCLCVGCQQISLGH